MWFIALSGNILRYIAHAILLKCENVCNTDIAGPIILQGGDNIEILSNPNGDYHLQKSKVRHLTSYDGHKATRPSQMILAYNWLFTNLTAMYLKHSHHKFAKFKLNVHSGLC